MGEFHDPFFFPSLPFVGKGTRKVKKKRGREKKGKEKRERERHERLAKRIIHTQAISKPNQDINQRKEIIRRENVSPTFDEFV